MRITGGRLGGRRLRAPPGARTRPTSDRVREALFSILGPPPPAARVLDAFAGAGTLGLEALSRGAERCTFIERAIPAVRCLRGNIAALGVEDRSRVVRGDAVAVVSRWARAAGSGARDGPAAWREDAAAARDGPAAWREDATAARDGPGPAARDEPEGPDARSFHWVFLDPPYRGDLAARMLDVLASGPLLAADAVVVVEHDRRAPPDPEHRPLVLADRRRYGDTAVSFYRFAAAQALDLLNPHARE